MGGEIIGVTEGSPAEELGLLPGDKILAVNEKPLDDIIDLSFALADEEIELLVEHRDGEREIIAFDKDIDEDLGCEFKSAVFDGIRPCANNCCFCFVNMTAPGMRRGVNIKDDDYRLSFLYGNFITLTNMKPPDFERLKRLHLSPLYVSIHAMNPSLRADMLRNPQGALINEQLDHLERSGISYHTQIVLCPGLNDGEELERSIAELTRRRPHLLSLAIVPVGLTKHRRDSFPLKQYDKRGAEEVIAQVRPWQAKMRSECGQNLIYLSDEFYLLAEEEFPPAKDYDGFPQLDNGIGLTRSFMSDWSKAKEFAAPSPDYAADLSLVVVAGAAAAPTLKKLACEAKEIMPKLRVRIVSVTNDYFGPTVNVSGLLTGRDIAATLRKNLSDREKVGILLPKSCLRAGEDIFLDDYTLTALREEFKTAQIKVISDGADFWRALTAWRSYRTRVADSPVYMWQSNAAYTK